MGAFATRFSSSPPGEEVASWLRTRGVELLSPITAALATGGHSNLTYVLTGADGRRVVLRRPPFDGILATAHDMNREWRFITAMRATEVPVPEPIAHDPSGDLLGAPFFVMSFVDGLVLHDVTAASELSLPARRAVSASLIDKMVALHAVGVDAVGLNDMARRDSYLDRQLRRWRRQWDQSVATDVALVAVVHERLCANLPSATPPSVVHGDFRLGNMICDAAGTIQAVLDWELATIGDPLADLGWLLSFWPEATDPGPPTKTAPSPSMLEGFPSKAWLRDRYQARSGRDLSSLDFYCAFAHWRSACISAGVLTRYQAGVMADDGISPEMLRRSITESAQVALALLEAAAN